MWTDEGAGVWRRQSAAPWAGRRSIKSRGAEVERSEARRVENNASATAHRLRVFGGQCGALCIIRHIETCGLIE